MTEATPGTPEHAAADATMRGDPASPPYLSPPQTPAWGAPPIWAPPPPKKRKVWPWVVGVVGGVALLGGAGTAVAVAVNGALHADQNDNYIGSSISSSDEATIGDRVIVSQDGSVAFEAGTEWVDAGDYMDASVFTESLPTETHLMGVYFTSSLATAVDHVPTLVMVIEGEPSSQIGPVSITEAHRGLVAGGLQGLEDASLDPSISEPRGVTTANGLDGLVSDLSVDVQGTPVRAYEYTFVRGKRVVFIQVMAYSDTFDDETSALVTDTLRIDN